MFNLDMGNVDPTAGTLASSQKEKLGRTTHSKLMTTKRRRTITTITSWLQIAKDNALVYGDCRSSRVNKSCSQIPSERHEGEEAEGVGGVS